MPTPDRHPFAKMNGIGNSILVVDARGAVEPFGGDDARRLGRGRLAFDQLMLILDPARPDADATVRIFNRDGSRAGACGNGTRCVAWFLTRDTGRVALDLDVEGTRLACRRDAEFLFTIDMGRPGLDWRDVPLAGPADTLAVDLGPVLAGFGLPRPAAVGMGNPHAVFFVPDAGAIDLGRIGPELERHPAFPDRANISFAQPLARDHILLRVWERGAGATLGCGSAACASVVAGVRLDRLARRARVGLPGGELAIEWRPDDDRVLMTGPVELEFEGVLTPAGLETAA